MAERRVGRPFSQNSPGIAALGSDVVLLQEVWTRRCFTDLSEGGVVTNRLWWTASPRGTNELFWAKNGLLTLSKYPIINCGGNAFQLWPLCRISLMHKAKR
jgi:hypothetical protein